MSGLAQFEEPARSALDAGKRRARSRVDTFASPDMWKNFADFCKLAESASKTAYSASRAKDEAAFRKSGAELRAVCDACHAAFMKQE